MRNVTGIVDNSQSGPTKAVILHLFPEARCPVGEAILILKITGLTCRQLWNQIMEMVKFVTGTILSGGKIRKMGVSTFLAPVRQENTGVVSEINKTGWFLCYL